jgi:protein TonB
VILEAIIEKDGTVRDAKVLRGLGFGLDEAARDALLDWRFEPGTLHGEPVPVRYTLSVDFAIR